jgi:hypothetical protein
MITPDFPDFRALCAELLQPLAEYDDADPYHEHGFLIERARAALATPPLEPPTDDELYEYWISTSPEFGCADPVGFARAVIERWGQR